MNALLTLPPKPVVIYPESDGIPMADNGLQFVWIMLLYSNLAAAYRDREDVFVCGNQNWFPREGDPVTYKAPDVYLVFGRPKGNRTSWKQWEENDTPMTVVFEILSPSNTHFEMAEKLAFYDDYGAQEYYVFDPEKKALLAYVRGKAALRLTRVKDTFTSPLMGIRFDLTGPEMVVYHADGRRFLSPEEFDAQRVEEAKLRSLAERQGQLAEEQRQIAEEKLQAAEVQRQAAERQRSIAELRSRRLADLGRKSRRGEATAEEMVELERLEQEFAG